jgi:acetoacetyl-CoA synthetase
MNLSNTDAIWAPSDERMHSAEVYQFVKHLQGQGEAFKDYWEFRDWTVENSEQFWVALWDYYKVIGDQGERTVTGKAQVETAEWFPDGKVNFAENLLRHRSSKTALVEIDANGERCEITFEDLERQVQSLSHHLLERGVQPGDVVAGVMDNSIPTVAACLAAAQIGAVWTACSVDFGLDAIVERLGQVSPKILFALSPDFNSKACVSEQKLEAICHKIPSISEVVICKGAAGEMSVSCDAKLVDYNDLLDDSNYERYRKFPFNQLLYILYSSGTTGAPKCIMHGAGGTLLQHIKELGLHVGLNENDTILFYTSCGWMMWNWLISSLFFGATVVLYGGSPIFPSPRRLFEICESEGITVLGTSPRYLEACRRSGVNYDLVNGIPELKTILSTGSVLQASLYDYVYEHIKKDVLLSSISGGSDIISCFCLGSEMLPVHRGESQTPGLAMDVASYTEDGTVCRNETGELVCRNAFPSRPLGFWGDSSGQKFHRAYFERFPNVWTHGDFIEVTSHNGIVFHGRSDATLNVGGVRVGTAEIYRQVSKVPEVVEAVAVEQTWQDGSRMLLLLNMVDGYQLDRKVQRGIRKLIRENLSEDHVPNKILQVPDLPRTFSGKTVELAIKSIVNGRDIKNIDAIENPESLGHIKAMSEIFC